MSFNKENTSYEPKWLNWARSLQAIAQNGLAYSPNKFDVERFQQIREISAEIIEKHAQEDKNGILQLYCRETDYATPKVDVRAAAFKDGKILMVKETSDHKWSLPGGWADINSSPSENVIRETFEESGFEVKPVKLAAVYDRSKNPHLPLWHYHIYKMFFICEIIGGKPTTSIETEEIAFFQQETLPELSVSKVLTKQIDLMFQHYKNPELPTHFD